MITPKVKEIRRDKDGFALDSCLYELYKDLPVLLYNSENNAFECVDEEAWYDGFHGDIDTKPYYTHYITATIS